MKTSRRAFLGAGAAVTAHRAAAQQGGDARGSGSAFLDVVRPPDLIIVHSDRGVLRLKRNGVRWQEGDVEVTTEPRRSGSAQELPVVIAAPRTTISRIQLRWQGQSPRGWRCMGDQWERSYGDLEWRGLVGERPLPWYFLLSNGHQTYGYGVKTGAASFCFWQQDTAGISLWMDVRNGGTGVQLGERRLEAAVALAVEGEPGISPFLSAKQLCRRLCERPRLPGQPVYGSNNWYYTYGQNVSAQGIVRDSKLLADLSPAGHTNRPFMVIDMGWGREPDGAGPVNQWNKTFPDMPGLAARMKSIGVRPGIWVRPLLTTAPLPEAWRMPKNRLNGTTKPPFFVIDPSVPEALAHIREEIRSVAGWGYELIKHDYSTFDILGRWGFQMGVALTNDGWHFADRGKTTAEIVSQLYRTIREAAGDAVLIGCNTVGHLGAGHFELQRIGDDTSGKDWNRTRRMGVNTLAFRAPQNGSFFAVDADCVPMTRQVPWKMTRQWLDLVARSGAPLFISADPEVVHPEQRNAMKVALAIASKHQETAEPVNWMDTTTPDRWVLDGRAAGYSWYGDEGASPFAH